MAELQLWRYNDKRAVVENTLTKTTVYTLMLCYLRYALCIHVSTGIVTLEIPSDEQAKFR